jgi:hypothetical protein
MEPKLKLKCLNERNLEFNLADHIEELEGVSTKKEDIFLKKKRSKEISREYESCTDFHLNSASSGYLAPELSPKMLSRRESISATSTKSPNLKPKLIPKSTPQSKSKKHHKHQQIEENQKKLQFLRQIQEDNPRENLKFSSFQNKSKFLIREFEKCLRPKSKSSDSLSPDISPSTLHNTVFRTRSHSLSFLAVSSVIYIVFNFSFSIFL